MTGEVLGRRVDRDIDAEREGRKIQRRRPAIVEHHHGAPVMGGAGDGGEVLDLEGE